MTSKPDGGSTTSTPAPEDVAPSTLRLTELGSGPPPVDGGGAPPKLSSSGASTSSLTETVVGGQTDLVEQPQITPIASTNALIDAFDFTHILKEVWSAAGASTPAVDAAISEFMNTLMDRIETNPAFNFLSDPEWWHSKSFVENDLASPASHIATYLHSLSESDWLL